MKSANLKEEQEDLVKATIGELNFENMKTHLKKIHINIGCTEPEVKEEAPFFVEEQFCPDDVQIEEEEVFYTAKPRQNVPDEFGKPTRCGYCQSIYHYVKDCPHAHRQRGGYQRESRGRSVTQGHGSRGRFVSRRPYNPHF